MEEIFTIKQIEASSPITKRPGSPFRNSSLFLSEVPCVSMKETKSEAGESNPHSTPVVTMLKAVNFSVASFRVEKGKKFTVTELADITNDGVSLEFDDSMLRFDGTATFTGVKEGVGVIYVSIPLGTVGKCVKEIGYEVYVVPPPDVPKPPVDEVCGIALPEEHMEVELGRATATDVSEFVDDTTGMTVGVTTSDPTIIEVITVSELAFELHFLKEGTATITITTRYPDGRICENIHHLTVVGSGGDSDQPDTPTLERLECGGVGVQDTIYGKVGEELLLDTGYIIELLEEEYGGHITMLLEDDEVIVKLDTPETGNPRDILVRFLSEGETTFEMTSMLPDGTTCTDIVNVVVTGDGGDEDIPNVEPDHGSCDFMGEIEYGEDIPTVYGCNIYRYVGQSTAGKVLSFDGNVFSEDDEMYVYDGDPTEGGTLLGSVLLTMSGGGLFSGTPTYYLKVDSDIDLYLQFNTASNRRDESKYYIGVKVHPGDTTNPSWIQLPMELPNPYGG